MPTSLRPLIAALLLPLLLLGGCRERDAQSPGQAEASGQDTTYQVVAGDSLISISARFDVPIPTIIHANHLQEQQLYIGQTLHLPGAATSPDAGLTPFPPAPVAESTLPASGDEQGGWFVPRSQWAVEPIAMADIVPMTRIFRLTVHHSGDEGDVVGDTLTMLRHFEYIHTHIHHWACIGYHFIIGSDGTVYEGRPLRFQGAHAVGDNNIGNIGICLIGDFDRQNVPEAQHASLIRVLDRLTSEYGISKAQIFGHEEFKNTACPGRHLMALVVAYRGLPAHPVR